MNLLEPYQHLPERIDPVVWHWSGFSLHWYAIAYFAAILSAAAVFRLLSRRFLSSEDFFDLLGSLLLGALLGARIGFVAFYFPSFYAAHPLAIFSPFDAETGEWIGISGMSYYGGLLGVACALWFWSRRRPRADFWRLADAIAVSAPLAYFFGRIGNFLNGELFGRTTMRLWGMFFPGAPDGGSVLRHPSQLYEASFEGIVLFLLLFFLHRKKAFFAPGALAIFALAAYAIFRFFLEFFREPDWYAPLFFGMLSLGQVLSVLVLLASARLFRSRSRIV